MAKPEWGTKRSCASCGAKFYDFHRDPIVCPKCDAKITVTSATRPKRARGARPEPVAEETKQTASEDEKVAAQIEDIGGDSDDVDDEDDTLLEESDELDKSQLDVDADDKAGDKAEDKDS